MQGGRGQDTAVTPAVDHRHPAGVVEEELGQGVLQAGPDLHPGAHRPAPVQVVATATLAAVTAWGGLGRFIVDGFAQRDDIQVVAGALLVALAVATELAVAGIQRLVVPVGLRTRETRVKDTARPGVQAA